MYLDTRPRPLQPIQRTSCLSQIQKCITLRTGSLIQRQTPSQHLLICITQVPYQQRRRVKALDQERRSREQALTKQVATKVTPHTTPKALSAQATDRWALVWNKYENLELLQTIKEQSNLNLTLRPTSHATKISSLLPTRNVKEFEVSRRSTRRRLFRIDSHY